MLVISLVLPNDLKFPYVVVDGEKFPTLRSICFHSLIENEFLFPPFVYNRGIFFGFSRSARRKDGKCSLPINSEDFHINRGPRGADVLMIIYIVQSPWQLMVFGWSLER